MNSLRPADDAPLWRPVFCGAVLAGGRSSRMGRNKAFIELDGEALVVRVARALIDAGASNVFVVGGDPQRLRELRLDHVPDQFPDEGPLGGVITALRVAPTALVAVLATDLISPRAANIACSVDGIGEDDVAVPVADGHNHYHHAVWHRRALPTLATLFDGGERAIKRAVASLRVVLLEVPQPAGLADADRPAELPPGAR